MATFSGLAPVRDDFRCSLCRQKNAFHCEHDTPYRDQLLGTYDQDKPYSSSSNSRREPHRTSSHHNNKNSTNHNRRPDTNTGHYGNTGQYANTSVDPRYQQGKRPENSSGSYTNTNTNPYGSMKTNEQKKKNKSCVIL